MEKMILAFKSLFTKRGWRLLQLAAINRIVVPLFKLQAWRSRSWIPGPTTISIELTNRCNLNCAMCVRRFWDAETNPLGDMSYEFFEEHILGELRPYQVVNLQCIGESLLNKDFLKMLAACKKAGCTATFTSNGVILRKFADAIVSHGADEICISVDGIETMKKWRYVDVDRVLDGIDAIREAKQKLASKTPLVTVNCVVTRDSLAELPELMERLGQKGVTRVTLIHLIAYDAGSDGTIGDTCLCRSEKDFRPGGKNCQKVSASGGHAACTGRHNQMPAAVPGAVHQLGRRCAAMLHVDIQ